MTDEQLEAFYNRKLAITTGEEREKVKRAIINRVIDHCREIAEQKERNNYYIKTNFGL